MLIALSVGLTLFVSLVAPPLLRPVLKRMGVIDVPNERSSHSRPILRGLGLAPLLAVLASFALPILGAEESDARLLTVVALVALASGVLGWLEDSRGLPVAVRAGAQLLIGLAGAGFAVAISNSFWLLVPILGIGIAGYINVANFMDGIDGISALHGVIVGAAFALAGALADIQWVIPAGLIIAAAFLGFLPWNIVRGGMFLGDVGSYLLGGSIAIVAAAALVTGLPVLAVIGPLALYLADTGVTLARRVVRGEPWYKAHRTHVYQRLTDHGLTHLQTAGIVTAATVVTSALGLVSLTGSWWAIIACAVAMAAACGIYVALPSILSGPKASDRQQFAAVPVAQPALVAVPQIEAMTWAVIGSTGFIGSALREELGRRRASVTGIRAPRLEMVSDFTAAEVLVVANSHETEIESLAQALNGVDVVINAAGLATPDSNDNGALYGANSLLPVVVALAAERAEVGRVVHLSSAAVQGRRKVLDESRDTEPFSPYSRSKALGEAALLELADTSAALSLPEIVVIRATSVQGAGRATTEQLKRLARSPIASVAGRGDSPTTVSSLRGLAEFTVSVGAHDGPVPAVVLQPWEGSTTAGVLELAGARVPLKLPRWLCRAAVAAGHMVGAVIPGVSGLVRRVELMWFGQAQNATWGRSVGLEGNSYLGEALAASGQREMR